MKYINSMAKAIYGANMTGISGSINKQAGGFTFTKNNVIRRRVVPTNPQTEAQSILRGLFAFMTGAWYSQLSDANRLAWETARKSNVYYEKQDELYGVSRKYGSAKDLFMAMNTNFLVATNDTDAPALEFTIPAPVGLIDAIGITSFVFDASAGTAVLTYTGGLAEENLVVRATPPVSAGVMRATSVKSQFRTISGSAAVSPIALGAAYVALFGAITSAAGQKVFWEVNAVNLTTGKSRIVSAGVSIIVA